MKLSLHAIGKSKPDDPEMLLFSQYTKRIPWRVSLREFDAKKSLPPPEKKQKESEWLLADAASADIIVALDESGRQFTSTEFAKQLQHWQNQGKSSAAFLIGGSDGHTETVKKRADMLLSLGTLTWPHLMIRAMLAEQLYRAHSILSGHPYHRG